MARQINIPEIKDVRELEVSDAYEDLQMPGIDLALVYRLSVHSTDLCEQDNPNSKQPRDHVALVNENPELPVRITERFSIIGCGDREVYPPDYPSWFQRKDAAEIIPLLRESFERVLGPRVCLGNLIKISRDPTESPIYRVQYVSGNGQIFTIASLIEPITQLERTRAALRCLGATGDLKNGTHITWNAADPLKEGEELVIRPELIGSDNIERVHVATGLLPDSVPEESSDPLTSIAERVFERLSEAAADI